MTPTHHHALTRLPAVDRVLQLANVQVLIETWGHQPVRDGVRHVLDTLRRQIRNGEVNVTGGDSDTLLDEVARQVEAHLCVKMDAGIKPVLNLTGTVIHTNLGRACLPGAAVGAMARVAGASNLEYDLETGTRGDRDAVVERWLCDLTGAEAATVVNNNAAALLLVLNTLAKGRQVPVSRGELVEIGGSFRVPEIMAGAGCTILEIGTTNRTHLADYENSITDETALLLKVHTSNYAIQGFTAAVSEAELAALAERYKLPVATDLGSGTLVDLQRFGLPKEPTATQMLADGVDVVTFSGDKLLGGPQAGLIVGKKHYLDQIKKNPLKRALRVDKFTLAALTEVLKLYANPEQLPHTLPTLRLLTRPLQEIETTAAQVLPPLKERFENTADVTLVACASQIGSGALPVDQLPSKAVSLRPQPVAGQTDAILNRIARAFRCLPVPVIGRVHDGALLFDLRCLEEPERFCEQLSLLDLSFIESQC